MTDPAVPVPELAGVPEQGGGIRPRFQIFWVGGGYRWRLLGANNRESGRAARGFARVELARDDAEDVRRLVVADAVEVELASLRGTHWTWRLSAGAAVRAESVRRYGRRTECERGLARFLAIAPDAVVSDSVLVGRQLTHSLRL